MKHLVKFVTIFILFLAFTVVNAQTFDEPSISRGNSELVIDFGMASTALDSAATDTSAVFSLEDYDGSSDDIFTLYTNLASSGTPKTDISIYGCETSNGTFVLLDAIQDAETDKGAVYTAFDIGDVRAKYYKLFVDNEDTGAALTGYHIKIRACKKDVTVTN